MYAEKPATSLTVQDCVIHVISIYDHQSRSRHDVGMAAYVERRCSSGAHRTFSDGEKGFERSHNGEVLHMTCDLSPYTQTTL